LAAPSGELTALPRTRPLGGCNGLQGDLYPTEGPAQERDGTRQLSDRSQGNAPTFLANSTLRAAASLNRETASQWLRMREWLFRVSMQVVEDIDAIIVQICLHWSAPVYQYMLR